MSTLPQFKKFNIHEETLGTRWKLWLSELENLLLALDIKDKKRQRAMLLYYAGPEVHNIYQTLTITEDDQNEDYGAAKKKLTEYFEPKVNITYMRYLIFGV